MRIPVFLKPFSASAWMLFSRWKPYEVEVISDHEATIRGENQTVYTAVAEEFRFYTPHITRFYDRDGKIVKEYPPVQVLTLRLEQI